MARVTLLGPLPAFFRRGVPAGWSPALPAAQDRPAWSALPFLLGDKSGAAEAVPAEAQQFRLDLCVQCGHLKACMTPLPLMLPLLLLLCADTPGFAAQMFTRDLHVAAAMLPDPCKPSPTCEAGWNPLLLWGRAMRLL